MKKLLLFLSLLLVQTSFAQTPKLVVGIVVEQMRYDYLTRYWDKFSESGFKKLYKKGLVYTNAGYDYLNINQYSSYANIATGTNPNIHGIVDKHWYDRVNHKTIDAVEDDETVIIGSKPITAGSPSKLLATTFADQLELTTFGQSKTIVIAPDMHSSILSSGTLCDLAVWYDDKSGNWVTSSFYTQTLPQWIKNFNAKNFANIYLQSTWETTYKLYAYNESLSDANLGEKGISGKTTFPYNLAELRRKNTQYEMLMHTPFFNTYTKDLALSAIVYNKLGKDQYTDYLLIGFGATARIAQSFGIRSVEIEDAYIKLDKDIAHLLSALDDLVGKGNYVVFLTSDRGACDNPAFLQSLGYKTNFFDASAVKVVLDTYLQAIYRSKGLIEHVDKGQIYFNQKLVDQQRIDWLKIESETASLLAQFKSVENAIPGHLLLRNSFGNGTLYSAYLSYNPKRSGDILFTLGAHSFLENEDKSLPSLSECYCSCNNNSHVPLIFYGGTIKPDKITRHVDVTSIAPTLSNIINIGLPEQSTAPVLQEALEK